MQAVAAAEHEHHPGLAVETRFSEQPLVFAEAKQDPALKFVARRAEQRSREVAAEKRVLHVGGEIIYPNDTAGYQRRLLDLIEEGASPEEIKTAQHLAKINVSADFNEKMQRLTWDLPEALRYIRGDDGRIYDGMVHEMYRIAPMLEAALSALNNPIEGERRIHESTNFQVIEAAGDIPGITNKAFIEISMCNMEQGATGYVQDTQKMQIRHSRYIEGKNGLELVVQPVYIDGRLWDEERMHRFLTGVSGIVNREQVLDRMLKVEADEFENVLDFVELMDEFASKEEGKLVGMGEYVEQPVEYDKLSHVAAERRKMFAQAVTELNHHLIVWAGEGLSAFEIELMYKELEKRMAVTVCEAHPEWAAVVMDESELSGLAQVIALRNAGDDDAADAVANKVAESVTMEGCGSSCGIDTALAQQASVAIHAGMTPLDGSEFKVDSERPCEDPMCGKVGTVVYGRDRRGNVAKICVDCGSTDQDGVVKLASENQHQAEVSRPKFGTEPTRSEGREALILSFGEVERRYRAELAEREGDAEGDNSRR